MIFHRVSLLPKSSISFDMKPSLVRSDPTAAIRISHARDKHARENRSIYRATNGLVILQV